MGISVSTDFGFSPVAQEDKVGIVNITRRNVRAQGGDSRSGQQHDVNFHPEEFTGPRSCVKVADRTIADTWLLHLGSVLKPVPASLAKRLAMRAGELKSLPKAWMEIMRLPWPGDAAANDENYERLTLIASLRKRFYDVNPEWSTELLRRYCDRPELIYADRATSLGVDMSEEAPEAPTASGPIATPATGDEMIDEFLRSGA